jgi:hypothetical protein
MKHTGVTSLFLIPLLSLVFTCCIQAKPMGDSRVPQPKHDPQRPFRAWVLCIDRSLSPMEGQFRKLQAVMESIAANDVTYNDLVWLCEIQSSLAQVSLFAMPAGTSRRSAGTAAADALHEAKAALIAAIHNMSQLPGDTNLQSPLEEALELLRSHPEATSRIVVLGSDFLSDGGHGRISVEPPASVRVESGPAVKALLLVTYPKGSYLQRIGISHSDLLLQIQTKWTAYLKKQNSSSIMVRLVDAIPVPGSR